MAARADESTVHIADHDVLLRPLLGDRLPVGIDAIAVPTHRPAKLLHDVVELARELHAPLLLLCSGDSNASEAREMLGPLPGAVLTLSRLPDVPLLDLQTARWHEPLARPYIDTGNKRNAALLIGRLLGWRRLLFVDDDVRGLQAGEIRSAAGGMTASGMRAVGWRYSDFPDNSVVCHARRAVGHEQGVFLGAGALLVALQGWLPFFPSVYNEDWLFWHHFLSNGWVGLAGEVTQLAYDPFAQPLRARQEEFGDVLAEGLVNLLHAGRTTAVAQLPEYWTSVLDHRSTMLVEIRRALAERDYGPELRSIEASQRRLTEISAEALGEFVSLWYRDLLTWNVRLNWLPHLDNLADALAWMGLREAGIHP